MRKIIPDGTRIIGVFQNEAVIGKVLSSRIHGKRLVYSVELANPITLRWRTEPVFNILLGNHEIKAAPL